MVYPVVEAFDAFMQGGEWSAHRDCALALTIPFDQERDSALEYGKNLGQKRSQ
jgi:hypothetical protein